MLQQSLGREFTPAQPLQARGHAPLQLQSHSSCDKLESRGEAREKHGRLGPRPEDCMASWRWSSSTPSERDAAQEGKDGPEEA